MSVAAHTGTRTLIYLRVGDNAPITTASTGQHTSLKYPLGSESDRVSMVRYRRSGQSDGSNFTVDDVRGTRCDANAREYFHVYRADGPRHLAAKRLPFQWLRRPSLRAPKPLSELSLVRQSRSVDVI